MIKTNYVSKLVQELKPSGIRKFFDLAANMEGVVSLGVGEPDFVTSWSVREAAISSLEARTILLIQQMQVYWS